MERTILIGLLFVFAFAFFTKMIVFGVLAHEMQPQEGERPLGRNLFHHYLAITIQAAFLSVLYFYYGQLAYWGPWPDAVRLTLYLLAIISVAWVIISGIRLLGTYFAVRAETEQLRQEAEERDALQDRRDERQTQRERRQDAREDKLDTREGLADTRQEVADTRESVADTRQATQDTHDTDREELP